MLAASAQRSPTRTPTPSHASRFVARASRTAIDSNHDHALPKDVLLSVVHPAKQHRCVAWAAAQRDKGTGFRQDVSVSAQAAQP